MPSKLSRTMNQTARPDRLLLAARALLAGAALAACAAGFAGCEKKKPPPPPVTPPAPAPPPPAPVTINTLMQDLGADSRVQFASGVEIIEEPFAKAVIQLADGLAKGDASKLKPMLTSGAKSVLDDLQSSGDWSDQTRKIEAVRVVYAGSPPSENDVNLDTVKSTVNDMIPYLREAIPELMHTGLTQDDVDRIMKKEVTYEALLEELKTHGRLTDEQVTKLIDLQKRFVETANSGVTTDSFAASAGFKPEKAVILAVQDPSGAYLLAWFGKAEGEESYVFSNAPSAGMSKRRASEFDGIGLAAISARDTVTFTPAGVKPAADQPADTKPSATAPADPPGEPAPGPIKKRTPAGPVTIPGGRAFHSHP